MASSSSSTGVARGVSSPRPADIRQWLGQRYAEDNHTHERIGRQTQRYATTTTGVTRGRSPRPVDIRSRSHATHAGCETEDSVVCADSAGNTEGINHTTGQPRITQFVSAAWTDEYKRCMSNL